MKRTFLLSLCVSYALVVSAIELTTEKNAPRSGDKFTNNVIEDAIDVGNSGIDQTWDFSGYSGGKPSTIQFMSASASEYPEANMVMKEEESGLETYISNATGITLIGTAMTGKFGDIENPKINGSRELIKFPLSYGTKYNETFSGILNAKYMGMLDIQFVIEGTVEIEADGYGTLILPCSVHQSVLRVKVTSVYTLEMPEMPGMPEMSMGNFTDVSYSWYGDTDRTPLANYLESSIGKLFGDDLYTNFSYLASECTSVNELRGTGKTALYPNPVKAGEKIMLLSGGSNDVQIEWQILTIGGSVIGSGMIDSFKSSIPTSQLAPGIYLLKLTENSQQTVQKLIVE